MPETPRSLTETPFPAARPHGDDAPADPLSAVLSLVRMRGEVICRSEFSAPFGLGFPAGAAHFHAVEAGAIWVSADADERPQEVSAGSFLLFPRGDGHTLMDEPGRRPTPLAAAAAARTDEDRSRHRFRFGGGGPGASLLCVRFQYENPVAARWLEALPRVVLVPAGLDRRSEDLARSARALLEEVQHPDAGSAIMIARLIDLIVIQMLRIWVRQHRENVGWLAGATDPRIGRALAAIHHAPQRPWTVPALASVAGLARSGFASRFTALVGTTPLAYLTEWRLNLAADKLRSGHDAVGRIARDVGYTSEAGFSRAFRGQFGRSPRDFRADAP